MAADPLYSKGARYERAAWRARLERMLKKWTESGSEGREAATYETELKWARKRQSADCVLDTPTISSHENGNFLGYLTVLCYPTSGTIMRSPHSG